MRRRALKQIYDGFTIVELLIVVVVIAILAAITIVAYNGISNRAKASAALAAAEQAGKKVMIYMATNGDTPPANLASADIIDQNGTTYQYRTYNSGQSYCITATSNGISAFINNVDQTSPAAGACPGHGANGGSVITNLAINPQATSYTTPYTVLGWNTGRWFGWSGSGSYSLVAGASDGPMGITSYARKTWSIAPTNFASSGDTGFDAGSGAGVLPVTVGQTWTASCYLRSSVNRNFDVTFYVYDSANNYTGRYDGTSVGGLANQWTRVSSTITVPANVASIGVVCDSNADGANAAVNWAPGNTLDGTALMVTQGSTLNKFADGSSTGWAWNGASNNSTSTGPAL